MCTFAVRQTSSLSPPLFNHGRSLTLDSFPCSSAYSLQSSSARPEYRPTPGTRIDRKTLERKLSNHILTRPQPEDLVQRGILKRGM